MTCPVAHYSATSDAEKFRSSRSAGRPVVTSNTPRSTSTLARKSLPEDIAKGYKVDTDTYIQINKDELDDIALEATHSIEIDEFVPKADIDYLVLDGKVGHDAFPVIRETIRTMNKVAIGRLVLTNRETHIAPESLNKA